MKAKSVALNSLLNVMRAVLKIVFPLLTYKRVSGILRAAELGKYQFAFSVVSYFSFIAALGVNTYSVRSGVLYRHNKCTEKKYCLPPQAQARL